MRRFFTFLIIWLWGASLIAQNQIFTLDDLFLPDTGFWNGSDTTHYKGGFGNQNVFFINHYTSSDWGEYWDGFAFSNWTDTITEGYQNQWSVYAGNAYSGEIFGLGYVPTDWNNNYQLIPIKVEFQTPMYPVSIQLTNSTYTALAIKNGTDYSEPFSNGDYYCVKIWGYTNGQATDTVIHYLADYRNNNTFVQKNWQEVDLTALGRIDSMKFTVFSTDAGQYGINTPAYFCFDDFKYSDTQPTIIKNNNTQITLFPNPATDYLNIKSTHKIRNATIYDLKGTPIINTQKSSIDIKTLTTGIYILQVQTDENIQSIQFFKN